MENKKVGKYILRIPEPDDEHRNHTAHVTENRVLKIQNILNAQQFQP